MNVTKKIVDKFVCGLGGNRYRTIFQLLESKGLIPLGKSNSKTLLFQFRSEDGEISDIIAFRAGPPPVISFPKSYWLNHPTRLSGYLSEFLLSEKPSVAGGGADAQYSAGQITLNRETYERIIKVCIRVCDGLS